MNKTLKDFHDEFLNLFGVDVKKTTARKTKYESMVVKFYSYLTYTIGGFESTVIGRYLGYNHAAILYNSNKAYDLLKSVNPDISDIKAKWEKFTKTNVTSFIKTDNVNPIEKKIDKINLVTSFKIQDSKDVFYNSSICPIMGYKINS